MSWSSAIGKAFGSIGGVMNAITGTTGQMDKSYKQQINAMNMQNAYNTRMWNLQNEYNTPASQLARMREAGIDINPTSYALGTGNLSNTAVKVDSAGGFAGSGSPAGNPISMLMGVASGVQGIKETKERINLTHEQGINAMIQGNNLITQGTHTKLENDIMRHNLKVARDTNTPVGSMPGFEQSATKYGNQLVEAAIDAFSRK